MRYVRARDLGVQFTADGRLLVRAPMRGVAIRAPAFVAEILTFCTDPRAPEDIEARYGAPARRLFDDLVGAGLLVDPAAAESTPEFFANFASLDVHRRMLADRVRVDGYARAIAAAVRPGCAVLDAGTGSGVLAALAALAGARVVYAVDNSDLLDVAAQVFAASGVGDRVKTVRADFRTVELPEKVDVIVTETFGAFGLAEDGLSDIAACAARNLAPGGRIVPEHMSLWLAPVADRALLDEAVGPFSPAHGVDLAPLRAAAWHRGITAVVAPGALAAPGREFARVRLGDPVVAAGTVAFEVPAEIVGFAGWFDLGMGDFHLSTAPAAPLTHWKQQYLPIDPFRTDGSLEVRVTMAPPADDRRGLEVTTAFGGRSAWHRLR